MAAPLRVLAMNSLAPPYGGAETHFADLVELLREHGAVVEVHFPEASAGPGALLDRAFNPEVHRFTKERIREFRPDVVHVHNFLRRLSVAPFLAARDAGVATLLTVHDFQLFCPRTWAIRADGSECAAPSVLLCAFGGCRGGAGRVAYALNTFRLRAAASVVRRHATRIVAPSAALASRLTRTLGREVRVLPYRPAPRPDPAFVPPPSRDLVFVGRISPEKGLREFLGALDPAQRLTIAGDGPALPELAALVRTRGLTGVRFAGRVPKESVAALVRDHGALVVPSVWMENSPLVVHEALAAGRPVLASRRGGIPEIVEDGVTGFLFDPLDASSIRSAIVRYASMPAAEHESMARRARARAESVSDRGAAFALMEKEYREAAALARAAARP